MSVIKPPNEEYKRYSQKLKAQDAIPRPARRSQGEAGPTPPAHRPYIHKPRILPHEDIYVSYFKLQDHYKQNGNPLNLPNPYRAKFIEMIEQSCANTGITKTQLKNEAYKLYLQKKEANDI